MTFSTEPRFVALLAQPPAHTAPTDMPPTGSDTASVSRSSLSSLHRAIVAGRGASQVRLLVIVEDVDYRAHLTDIFLPEMMPDRLAERVNSADAQLLNSAAAWSQQGHEVAIFSSYSKTAYSEVCYLGMRLMGSGLTHQLAAAHSGLFVSESKKKTQAMVAPIADFCPTHIVMSTPNYSILKWANRRRIASILLLSEWQEPLGWKQRYRHRRLLKQMNHRCVQWVGSQGIPACNVLANSGIAPDKLIPWEWPRPRIAIQHPPKQLDYERDRISLLYVGKLDEPSQIGGLLLAVSHLKQRGHTVELQIVGDELTPRETMDLLYLQSLQLEVADEVTFSTVGAFEPLLAQARAADIVVILGYASHLRVGEPPIAVQIAMSACTPIVACDRAELQSHLFHGVNAMIFPEGNEKSMVHRIERLMGQPQLYAQLSEAGSSVQSRVNAPASWQDIIDWWIQDSAASRQWLRNCALSSGRYQTPAFLQR